MNPMHFVVKFNKSLNMKNLFVCTITSENNNEQYLVSYLMLPFWEFFIKELACSVVVHTFTFLYEENAVRLVLLAVLL